MKRDEKLIRRALLQLSEAELAADFPDRQEKNRELINTYMLSTPARASVARRKRLVAVLSATLMLALSFVAVFSINADGFLIRLKKDNVTGDQLIAMLEGKFALINPIGDYSIAENPLVYSKRDTGEVVFARVHYSDETDPANILDFTLIAISENITKFRDYALFESLIFSDKINGITFKYEISTLDNIVYANLNMGKDKYIWLVMNNADKDSLFELIAQLTAPQGA